MFGLPVAVVVALVSYGTTGKGVTDNVVSFVTQEDCALHYVFPTGSFCKEIDENVVITVEREPSKHIIMYGVSETAYKGELKSINDFKASIKW